MNVITLIKDNLIELDDGTLINAINYCDCENDLPITKKLIGSECLLLEEFFSNKCTLCFDSGSWIDGVIVEGSS